MKKLILTALCAALLLTLAGCGKNDSCIMKGTVTKIEGATMYVTPVDGSAELNSSDCFAVGIQNMPSSPEPKVGDTVEVTYSGEILETYPASFADVISVTVVR